MTERTDEIRESPPTPMPDQPPEFPLTGTDVLSLSLERARRVNAVCERFETDRRAGLPASIEEAVGETTGLERERLLAELLMLDIELRREGGEQPEVSDYLVRFPADALIVASAFTGGEGSGEIETIAYPAQRSPLPLAGLADIVSDLGDFTLIEEIARGGMGLVFKARKKSLNCLVALKVIRDGPLASAAEKRRFLLEAESAANLDHPNIVPVYEIDRGQGLFFTMKWVEGGSLTEHVARLVRDPQASARLLVAIARAVDHAHGRGILHRDLKPGNILLDAQGKPYVADFGLARRVGQESELTQTGAVLGTPSYMAPEQAGGLGHSAVGPTADVYSLGAILYELLTGRPPFRGENARDTLVLVLERDPIPPRRICPGVPRELQAICLRCLEKDPANRYPSAAALADDLDRYLRGEGVEADRVGLAVRLRRWTRREPELVARLVGLGVVAILTQYNYQINPHRELGIHLGVMGALAAWSATSTLLQFLARRERWSHLVRPAWTVADVTLLTVLLRLLDAANGELVVGYPLVVAVSGLWFRVGSVWLATALAELAYSLLALDAWRRGTLAPYAHPNIVMAAIAVTGFVVVRQVRRILVLSSYYELKICK